MELQRIGEKLISRNKINNIIDQILEQRLRGFSQQEVANRLNLDRTFISRLEKIGEVRKGNKVAVVGFPVENKRELVEVLAREGVDFWLLMTDQERWEFARNKNGLDFMNHLMELVARIRSHDVVVVLGSNYRIRLSEALLDREVVGVELGQSPIEGDVYVDPEALARLIRSLIAREKGEIANEEGCQC
ncbi:MAG: transcriptional regulator [Bacillota bacterium]